MSERPVVCPWIFVCREGAVLSLDSEGRSLFRGNLSGDDVGLAAIVLVVEGDIAKIIERAKQVPRGPNVVVLAAVGPGPGHDMSGMSGIVDGIVLSADTDTFDAWNAVLRPMLIGLRYPEYEDTLDPAETQGGVPREEFEDTLQRTARGDAARGDDE